MFSALRISSNVLKNPYTYSNFTFKNIGALRNFSSNICRQNVKVNNFVITFVVK